MFYPASSRRLALLGLGHFLTASLAVALACAGARAQSGVDYTGTGGRHVIQGRLVIPSGQRTEVRLKVRLRSSSHGEITVVTDTNGTFGFRSLRPGTYTVVVEGGELYETMQESVFIDQDFNGSPDRGMTLPPITRPYSVQFYLRPKRQAVFDSVPGTLDASLASVPKPAVEQYQKGMELARKREYAKAVEALRAAVTLHPDFALAHSALGTQYLALKEPGKAAEALRAALKLTPEDYVTLVTYGFALIEQREYARAEEPLRHALRKNAALPFAHYQLGVALLRQKKLPEAEASLRKSIEANIQGDHRSLAHYYLGGLYWATGDFKRAVSELETYLALEPDLPERERERVRATVQELRRKM